jgi:hypothetical protein
LDPTEIYSKLEDRLKKAKEWRNQASARFNEATKRRAGIAYPDSTFNIEEASRDYGSALKAVTKATVEINEFLLHGRVPAEDAPDTPGKK